VGAKFVNVQVRARAPTTAAELEELVIERVSQTGFVIVEPDEDADREVVIVRGDRWISLYDVDNESQDSKLLEAWGKSISERIDTTAMTVLVHDSDALMLSLYERGVCIDEFNSNPELFGGEPSAVTPAERAAIWATILAPAHDAAELAQVFAARPLFAEDALGSLAPAIGVDVGALQTGYYDLPTEVKGAIRIRARRAEPMQRFTGPPIFGAASRAVDSTVAPARVSGQPFRTAIAIENRGDECQGIHVTLAGEGIGEIVTLEEVEVVISVDGYEDHHQNLVQKSSDGWRVELLDLRVPAGLVDPNAGADGTLQDIVLAKLQHEIRKLENGLRVVIVGRCCKPGTAVLRTTIAPLTNPEGAHTQTTVINVRDGSSAAHD
jgi:hypothetical protein